MSDAPDEFETQLCSRADRAEQARLFNECFKKHVDAEALAWRYDRSPHGASVSLVARPKGGEGVSGYACSPRLALSFGDEATLAPIGETGDVMTHPKWRKRGLFSVLDRAAMAETARLGWPLAFGLPNHRSAHIFVELGWETIGTVRPWSFVLRGDSRTRAARSSDGRWRAWTSAFAARRSRRVRSEIDQRARGVRSVPLSRFPREVLALAKSVEKRFALMVRRDADYLNWRFQGTPSGLHRAIGIFDDAESLLGYVVVQLPRKGDVVGYLVDVLALDERTLAAAFSAGIAELVRADAGLIRATAIEGSWWENVLEEHGFVGSRPENRLSVILHPHREDHPLVKAARDVRGWYFTDGDRDDETMG